MQELFHIQDQNGQPKQIYLTTIQAIGLLSLNFQTIQVILQVLEILIWWKSQNQCLNMEIHQLEFIWALSRQI